MSVCVLLTGPFTHHPSRPCPIRSSETLKPLLETWGSWPGMSSSALNRPVWSWPQRSSGSILIVIKTVESLCITFSSLSLSGLCFTTAQRWSETWSGSYLTRSTTSTTLRFGLCFWCVFSVEADNTSLHLFSSERRCVGGGFDNASWSRQYHSPQRHCAQRTWVQRVDWVSVHRSMSSSDTVTLSELLFAEKFYLMLLYTPRFFK